MVIWKTFPNRVLRYSVQLKPSPGIRSLGVISFSTHEHVFSDISDFVYLLCGLRPVSAPALSLVVSFTWHHCNQLFCVIPLIACII